MFLAVLAALLLTHPGGEARPPRTVPIPRVADAVVAVDGRLDEPVWGRAAVLRDFWQYLPTDGVAAEDSTVVLVWYSPTAIYFGIRAYQDSAGVRATVADRDHITGDDYVEILLDTFNDRRRAFLFGVNPLGVQADGTLRDTTRSIFATSTTGTSEAYAVDLSPDFVYESRGRQTAYGYEVEIRIPFQTLRYPSAQTQDWGINVIRRIQATGHETTWTPVRQADASFLAASGVLAGLTGLRAGIVLDLTPEVTSTVSGGPGSGGGWDYHGGEPRLGGSVRWGVTSNLSLNGTVKPDFSQVEADVAQLQYDPRSAVYFPESRPFFLDGLEYFRTPVSLMYTRRLVQPDAAFKLTGKSGGTSLAVLTGVDDSAGSAVHPVYNWLRLQRDVGGQSTLGLALTDREAGGRFNRVGAVDGRLVFGGAWTMVFQGGGSVTRDSGAATWAPFWSATLNRSGRSVGFAATFRGFHPDFQTSSGFVSRVNTAFASVLPSYTHHGAPGALLETWWVSLVVDGDWDYERLFAGDTPNHSQVQLSLGSTIRGGWQLSSALYREWFRYPAELYVDYAVMGCAAPGALPTDTVAPACARPFAPPAWLRNLGGALTLSTPRFQTFSLDASVTVGSDENFFEWASATLVIGTFDLTWRPSGQLRVNLLYDHQQYIRPDDGSTVRVRRVPRLKLEYQLTRSIFLRFVGQYDAQRTDALRDDGRTDAPLLVCAARAPATGACTAYTYAAAVSANALRADWLFSYRPTPGTVVFVGYGGGLEEPEAFRFRGLYRVSDGFFAKVSYLFRS